MKYWTLWKKSLALELSTEMAYKWNFFIKMLALAIADIVGPLIILLIYSNTSGIPGWSFEEFLLFQGTFILVFGIAHFALIMIPYKTIDMVKEGTFDKVLIKPYDPLLYMTFSAVDLEGIAEVFVGIGLITYSFSVLNIAIGWNLVWYLVFIALALVFQYAILVLIASLSFLVVKSFALLDIMFQLSDFARYPLSIFGSGFRLALTFFFPIAISAFYPVEILLRGLSPLKMIMVALPIFVFLGVGIGLWKLAMKKYTSAGG